MTGTMSSSRLRLTQARAGSDREHQALIGHLQDLRPSARVPQQPAFGLQQHEIQAGQQLFIAQVGQVITQPCDNAIGLGSVFHRHPLVSCCRTDFPMKGRRYPAVHVCLGTDAADSACEPGTTRRAGRTCQRERDLPLL